MTFDEEELQRLHEQAQAADPDHDLSSCWCCCWNPECEARADQVLDNDRETGTPGHG